MPNRIIKESICRSDSIDSLSWFEEVLFYRLIVSCDDYGRFDGRTAIIKGSCFPLKDVTNKDIEKALDKLSAVGLVRGYEVQGRPFLQLTTWEQHQQIRAKKSKYPAFEETCNQLISDDCNSPRNPIQSESEYKRDISACALSRFEDFWKAYPREGNRQATEVNYCRIFLNDCNLSEDSLVKAAENYAEYVKILNRTGDFITKPENFLKNNYFVDFLPGQYKKPDKPKGKSTGGGNKFNQYPQREYDFEALEKELLGY